MGSKAPTFSTSLKSSSFEENAGSSFSLMCQAQAFPVPTFRYAYTLAQLRLSVNELVEMWSLLHENHKHWSRSSCSIDCSFIERWLLMWSDVIPLTLHYENKHCRFDLLVMALSQPIHFWRLSRCFDLLLIERYLMNRACWIESTVIFDVVQEFHLFTRNVI